MKAPFNFNRPVLGYLNYLIAGYALITLLIARAFDSSVFSALLVAPNVLLVPYLLGSSVCNIIVKQLRNQRKSFEFLISFLVGVLFLHSSFVLLEFFGFRIDMFYASAIIIFAIALGFVIDLYYKFIGKQVVATTLINLRLLLKSKWTILVSLIIVVIIAFVAFYIPKMTVPFPMTNLDGGVGHETLKPVNRLLNSGILDIYRARGLPVILEGLACYLSGLPVQSLNWAAPLSTCLFFAFSVFFLAFIISGKQLAISLVATILVFFLNDSGLYFDTMTYIFRYTTILDCIFPLALLVLYLYLTKANEDNEHSTKPILGMLIVTAASIGLLWVFEFLQPAFMVSIFSVNEFLRPFVYLSIISVAIGYACYTKNKQTKFLVLILGFFSSFAIALDILRPVFGIAFIYIFLILLLVLTKNSLANTLSEHRNLKFPALKLFFSGTTQVNLLRIVCTILAFVSIILITGNLSIAQFSTPLWTGISNMPTKTNSLIQSDTIYILILSIILAIFLLYSKRKEISVFGAIYIIGLSIYFLPVFELYYIAYEYLNLFMAMTISLGLFALIHSIIHKGHKK